MRYAPGRSFPAYAFLPGRDPHPTRDPAGHSFGDQEEPESLPAPEDWRLCEPYLFGADLYNHGYLWEAHEAWEGLWHLAREAAPHQARFLQGLIQCAAGCLKIPMGQPRGLARLVALGLEKLEATAVDEGPCYMGLEIAPFVEAMRTFAASEPDDNERRPRLVLD